VISGAFEETASIDFLRSIPVGQETAPPLVEKMPAAETTIDPTWALAGLLALEVLGPPEAPRRWVQEVAKL
jgi:hypothetical protein